MLDIDFGSFTNVRQVFETNPLEPDAREYKYYASGFGLILVEEGLDLNFQNPEISVELISSVTPVPVPAALPLLFSGIAAFGVAARRRNKQSA